MKCSLLKQYLSGEKGRVLFIGTFKSGKSSLINALLREKLLPVGCLSTTAVVTTLYYSEHTEAFYVEKTGAVYSTTLEKALEFCKIRSKDLSGIVRYDVKEVRIGIPNPFLSGGLVIKDTAGIGDDGAFTEEVWNEVSVCEFIVVVLNAVRFLSQEERSILDKLQEIGKHNLFIYINFTEELEKEDLLEIIAYIRRQIAGCVLIELRQMIL